MVLAQIQDAQWICGWFKDPDRDVKCVGAASVVFGRSIENRVGPGDVYSSGEEVRKEENDQNMQNLILNHGVESLKKGVDDETAQYSYTKELL